MIDIDNKAIVHLHLSKSDEYLRSAHSLIKKEDWSGAVSFLYYAGFHSVVGLLKQSGIVVRSHSGTKQMFADCFIKTDVVNRQYGRFYTRLYRERDKSDHKDFATFTEEDVLPLVPQTEEFITIIKSLIGY